MPATVYTPAQQPAVFFLISVDSNGSDLSFCTFSNFNIRVRQLSVVMINTKLHQVAKDFIYFILQQNANLIQINSLQKHCCDVEILPYIDKHQTWFRKNTLCSLMSSQRTNVKTLPPTMAQTVVKKCKNDGLFSVNFTCNCNHRKKKKKIT